MNSLALGLEQAALHTNGVCAQNSTAAAWEVSLAREPTQPWDG